MRGGSATQDLKEIEIKLTGPNEFKDSKIKGGGKQIIKQTHVKENE